MNIKKLVLYQDIIKPTLQSINPLYRGNFALLDFNKIAFIRFMKDIKKLDDGSYVIPMYFDRFQVFGYEEMPEFKPNYISYEQLWDKELRISPIEIAS